MVGCERPGPPRSLSQRVEPVRLIAVGMSNAEACRMASGKWGQFEPSLSTFLSAVRAAPGR